MKIFIPIIILTVVFSHSTFSQPGEWVWLHGDNVPNGAVNYGVLGVPAATNTPPSVYEPCEWRDLAGNFWLYGGNNGANFYADLWKYNPVTNEWTWVKGPGTPNFAGNFGTLGVPDPANNPPAKGYCSATWTDLNGDLWLFGGLVTGPSSSDLWRYNIAANEWTWMSGSNVSGLAATYGTQGIPSVLNNPGDRWECASSWTDNSGDLWLFGGYTNSGTVNDLWRFNITTREWTWMKGLNGVNGAGTWGTRGVEDPANVPSSRASYTHWKDATGNFWCFGGYEFNSGVNQNDMWRYNPSTNNWTWMTGSSSGNSNGVYGTQCVADSSNTPGARYESRCVWTDQFNNFWLLGGRSCCVQNVMWNDLWTYCTATNKWTWVSGNNTVNPAGSWGTIGVSSPANHPNSRAGAVSWSDQNGGLYLFGGSTNPYPTAYNDLWKFTVDYSCVSCSVVPVALFTSPNHICPGTCTDFINNSLNATSFQWTFSGGVPATSTDVNPQSICYATPGTYDVMLVANNASGSDTLLLPNYITVYPYPAPQGITQSGDTLYANQGGVAYQWYHNGVSIPGATSYFYVAPESGDYNVVATDINGCEVEAVIFDVIAGLAEPAIGGKHVAIFPNPVTDELHIDFPGLSSSVQFRIYDIPGKSIQVEVKNNLTIDCRYVSPGIYFLEVMDNQKSYWFKFVKQ